MEARAAQSYVAAVSGDETQGRQILWARRAVHLGRGKVWWTSLCRAGRLHPHTLFAHERRDRAACLPGRSRSAHAAM